MKYENRSKFSFPNLQLDEDYRRSSRRHFVLIALSALIALYMAGIAIILLS